MIDQQIDPTEISEHDHPFATADADALDPPALQTFTLKAFDVGEDGAEDLELVVLLPEKPSVRRHASMALLYGLAILSLDQENAIQNRMEELAERAGDFINEVDACNQITFLLMKDANDQRI